MNTAIRKKLHTNHIELTYYFFRSTNEKISYHFIHANPTILFDNTSNLGIFIKTIIHFLLTLVAQHKCRNFDIIGSIPVHKRTLLNLIQLLGPYVHTLRKYCISCETLIPYISIADIAHLLVQNNRNEWTTALDTNVYLKNQQFRMLDSVKHGKNNPLVPSTIFHFESRQHSFSDLLKKSLITFIEDASISKICRANKRLRIDSSSDSKSVITMPHISTIVELANKQIDCSFLPNQCTTSDPIGMNLHSSHVNQCDNLQLSFSEYQVFTRFVEKIIMSDPSHQGYIHSCVRGTYNKHIIFFNIAGNYRFCPKKNSHHRHNTVAIMINTKNCTYSIRCKDSDCDNSVLRWEKIM